MNYGELLRTLEPYMEVTDAQRLVKNRHKLESMGRSDLSFVQQLALGVTYHELCVMHYLLKKDKSYAQFAQKSLDTLRGITGDIPAFGRPILDSYIVSARSLVASVQSNPIELMRVIRAYDKLILQHAQVSHCPEFLQGGLLENLPNIFGAHAKARRNFRSIVSKYSEDNQYCSPKIISFCYLGLAKLEKNKQAKIELLNRSLAADVGGDGATMMASKLLQEAKG